MIWNCDGEIKEIGFEDLSGVTDYYCWIEDRYYAWETGWSNAGPWDWYRVGYTFEFAEWVKL